MIELVALTGQLDYNVYTFVTTYIIVALKDNY